MSVFVCHGWVSVQTKAPQRTKAHVINLSGRQDLKGSTRQGEALIYRRSVSCWDLASGLWLAYGKALPSTSCSPDCPIAPLSLLNLWVLHWLLPKVSRQMHHLSAATSPGRELARRESDTSARLLSRKEEVMVCPSQTDLSLGTVWRWVTWLVDGYLWNDRKKKVKKGHFSPTDYSFNQSKSH